MFFLFFLNLFDPTMGREHLLKRGEKSAHIRRLRLLMLGEKSAHVNRELMDRSLGAVG